ncbi:frizzled-like, partial [Ruditapes philippinarum]|uniref:frizzled-like n=1 Tax=Ruditapes philippinarum TaxID=129788 RepID=UPI00295A89AC
MALKWFFIFIFISYLNADIDYSDETYLDGFTSKCTPLERRDGVCEVILSFYNISTFPNMLGHQSIEEAKAEFLDFQPLIDAKCSKSLEKLLCFIYFPPCTTYNSLLKVCQSYCEEAVTKKCREILKSVKKRPPVLECGQYPRSDSKDNIICITPNDTLSKSGGTVYTTTIIYPNYIDETSEESKE